MTVIQNVDFPEERALYGAKDVRLVDCTFDGDEDGESALKEGKNVVLERCHMNLRYPLWHCDGVALSYVTMTDKCRAALWYSENISAKNCRLFGIKALRECRGAHIHDCEIKSPEFGWKSENVQIENCSLEGEYAFLEGKNLSLKDVKFCGKYSFQYVENMTVQNCTFDTKDAFWHTKNVTVKNSVVKGEYLGWYAENLTFIDCAIIGTQPLCYSKNLKLENCIMKNTDLAFEYSSVNATVKSEILSVKNPLSGKIVAKGYGDIILTEDSKYPCECEILKVI